MSHLDDVQAGVTACIEKANACIAAIGGTKDSMEEVAGTFEAVGAEGKASLATEQTDQFEQAQATLQSVIEQFNAVYAQAESLKTAGGADSSSTDPSVITGADESVVPRSQWRNEVGDKLEPVEAPGEHPADRGMGKFQASARSMARGAGRYKEQSENLAKAHKDVGGFKPPVEGSYPSVSTPTSPLRFRQAPLKQVQRYMTWSVR